MSLFSPTYYLKFDFIMIKMWLVKRTKSFLGAQKDSPTSVERALLTSDWRRWTASLSSRTLVVSLASSLPLTKSAICKCHENDIIRALARGRKTATYSIYLLSPTICFVAYADWVRFTTALHLQATWVDRVLSAAAGRTVTSWAIWDTPIADSNGLVAALHSLTISSSKKTII